MNESNVTPNVVIENPDTRRAITNVLSWVGLVLGTVVVIDAASAAFDLSVYTVPSLAGYAYLSAAFGLGVTRPNTPKL